MTQMQKTIEALKAKGTEFKVEKNPYGGYYVKYPVEKFCGHKYTFWQTFNEDGTEIRKQSHVSSI
jgi:hypothetical protein